MASIIKRGPRQYQSTVRRRGHPTQSRTFEHKAAAEAWARDIEATMARGRFLDPRGVKGITLAHALAQYEQKVSVNKRGHAQERYRIQVICKHPMAQWQLVDMRSCDFADYRDERLKSVGANTVRLELALLSHLYTIAIKEWSWPLEHALRNVRKPKAPPGRERRLEGDEEQRLLAAIDQPHRHRCRVWLKACLRLAIETGMRAGEILSLEWSQVHLSRCVVRLDTTKNGDRRTVPLSSAAVTLLQGLLGQDGASGTVPTTGSTRVIQGFHDTSGLDWAFGLACRDARIEGLRFHDLRHEAATRMAPHMKPQELAKVLGWKTLQMAMRYYNPSDEDLVNIVRRLERAEPTTQF